MSDDLPDWPRPNYRPGGGDAFLFYVMFGPIPAEFAISRSRYRCSGIPEGIELVGYGPGVHPEVIDRFREGYLWDKLHEDDAGLARRIEDQTECLKIIGTVPDPEDLNYFRNVVGLIEWLFDSGGVGLYDPQRFYWWSADEWHNDAFESEAGSPRQHVMILLSELDDGTWIHTRGLRKFGRPDLSIHGVPADMREPVIELFNRFIEFQAFGGVINEGEEIRMESLPSGMTCHHRGDHEDPDFNNVHVEIEWPGRD